MTEASIFLGDLDLNDGPAALAAGADYCFELLAEGFAPGSPEAVRVTAASMLLDGDDESIDRWGNRVHGLRVRVTGVSVDALHAAQQALSLALVGDPLSGRTELTVTIPGASTATVYDVLSGDQQLAFDDLGIVLRNQHIWELALHCLPWARGGALVTASFAPGAGGDAMLSGDTTLSNWTATEASISSVTWLTEAAIKVDAVDGEDPLMEWLGAWPATPYVLADIAPGFGNLGSVRLETISTGALTDPVTVTTTATGYKRYRFPNPGAAARLRVHLGGSTGRHYYLGGFGTATALPASGVLVAAVPGSVRTAGDITASGTGLSKYIYTDPVLLSHGFSPDDPTTWPNAPAGEYVFYYKKTNSSAGTATLDVVGPSGGTVSLSQTHPATGAHVPIGITHLGGQRDGLLGAMTFAVNGAAATASPTNLLMFRVAKGSAGLTYAYRSGGVSPLTVAAPSLENPTGGVYRGSDELDASGDALAVGQHILTPGQMGIWSAGWTTTTKYEQTITASFYGHDHTYRGTD